MLKWVEQPSHIADLSEIKVFVCFLLLCIYWSISDWETLIICLPVLLHIENVIVPWAFHECKNCDITRSFNCINTIICVIKIFCIEMMFVELFPDSQFSRGISHQYINSWRLSGALEHYSWTHTKKNTTGKHATHSLGGKK